MESEDRERRRRRRERSTRESERQRRAKKPAGKPPKAPPELEPRVREVFETMGFHVVEYRFAGRSLAVAVDSAVDGPRVTVGDCARLTRELHALLEEVAIDPGDLDVEVASAGLDRRLHEARDFARFAGREVSVTLHEKRDGRRRFHGTLVRGDDARVEVETADGGPLDLALDEVAEIRLVPDL